MKYTCYCGSKECPPAQCRFYKDETQFKKEIDEFYKQWAQMEARDYEDLHGQR